MSVSVQMRSLSDIADEINRSMQGSDALDKMIGSEVEPDVISSPSSSLGCSKAELLKAKELEAMQMARQETYLKLKARKEDLQQDLLAKLNRLRELCLKEAEITGVVPPELPLMPGESLPQVRKRIGTTFVLSQKCLNDGSCSEEDQLKKFEMGLEIQEKIMLAEMHLAQDKSLPKSVRKKHRRTYRQAYQKLKELEGRINTLREQVGRERVIITARSLDDLSEDSREFLDDDTEPDASATPVPIPDATPEPELSPSQKSTHNYYRRYTHHELSNLLRFPSSGSTPKGDKDPTTPRFFSPEGSLTWSTSPDDDVTLNPVIRFYPKKMVQSSHSPRSSPCRAETSPIAPGTSRVPADGCSVSSAQSSESQTHPAFSKRKQSASSISSDFTNSCSSSMSSLQQNSLVEREENLYNINTYLTGCYESGDEILNPSDDSCLQRPMKHGSLDRRHSSAQNRYDCLSGSLELPEFLPSKLCGKPDPAAADYGDTLPADVSSRLLRKNCSERLRHKRKDHTFDPAAAHVGTKEHLAANVFQFPGSLDRSASSSSSSSSRPRHPATPVLYIASPSGRLLDSQIPYAAYNTLQTNTSLSSQLSLSSGTPTSIPGFDLSADRLTESSVIDVLDSPEKLAIFRKERYGRAAGFVKAPLPSGNNKDAVDALFRHHEESTSMGGSTSSTPQVSTLSSSSLYESSSLS